jgi:hypothetical protein
MVPCPRLRVCSRLMRFPLLSSSVVPVLGLLTLAACGDSTPPPASPAAPPAASAAAAAPAAPAVDPNAPKPESAKVTWKKDPAKKNCHSSARAADLTSSVPAIATGCIDASKMKQVGSPTTGEGQSSSATMVKSIPLAAKANHCYRIFGLAEPTVTDFDIAVMDSAGKSAGEDTTDTNDAIVLEDGSICFTQDDAATVNTAVATGKGKWAVEIWSD